MLSYYSMWSTLFTLVAVCIIIFMRTKKPTQSVEFLQCAVIANSVSVGAVGAATIAYSSCGTSNRSLLISNLYMHAIPSLGAAFMLMDKNMYRADDVAKSVTLLTVMQVVYLLLPFQGSTCMSKLRHVYHVEPVLIAVALLVVQFSVHHLVMK